VRAEQTSDAPEQALKLTVYLNEALRSGTGLAADALLDLFGRERPVASVLLRGIEGFGARHRLHTDRLENAALNQPVIAVAVDRAGRIESLREQVDRILPSGLVTAERAWLVGDRDAPLPPVAHNSVKLTVYCPRSRAGAVLAHLHECRVPAATAFLGVDGTLHGRRARARFLARNRDVPMMIVAVGDAAAVSRALARIDAVAEQPVVTVEGIEVCRRDGSALTRPVDSAAGYWRKLMIQAPGNARAGDAPLHPELVEQLRRTGTAGATSLRGFRGYQGNGAADADSVWSIRRSGPVVTVVIDRDGALDAAWPAIELLTRDGATVTSELVPAHRAVAAPRTGPARSPAARHLAIAAGGVAGTYTRVLVGQAFGTSAGWPWATFLVNMAGAFLLGYLTARMLDRLPPSRFRRPLLGSGLCGALTTFSTLQLELLDLLRDGRAGLAAAYAGSSVVVGFAAFMSAVWLVRRARVTS
jgi:protein CrcB